MSIKKSSQHVAINSHFIRSKTITGTNWGVSVSPAPAYSYQETPNSICRNQLVFKTKGSMKKKLERSKLFREMLRTSSLRVCMVQSNFLNLDVGSPTHVDQFCIWLSYKLLRGRELRIPSVKTAVMKYRLCRLIWMFLRYKMGHGQKFVLKSSCPILYLNANKNSFGTNGVGLTKFDCIVMTQQTHSF